MTASNFLYKASWFKLGQQKLSKSTGSLNTISTLPVPGIRSYHKVTLIAAVFLIYFHRWIIFYRCRKPSSSVVAVTELLKTINISHQCCHSLFLTTQNRNKNKMGSN
ncbi:hypothetical protein F4703DRAFT_1799490 [Phycomyces blakesleeanus]|uniref:Uncharacterized protein n=1 Tax=Phycomyces blakesleeanus (strain ATCC 8743b / DSM 1359 / FGSC 10004 / NBRC 33097 / NRRL 1555) TaxID=763407 RepID=A0A162PLY6_PHYB8|nr:hypothetical protein PHYBLDRAFT_63932 [Phycomyces blakesleeanus NRRL 1555(-)]OAD74117.1 hypothetical protein PHYBLDRAFT_63932 [Phycomyces blakesleeanus NRRL 1555(-)]|eukprot:XP_018292157.1 hypothetical protein PHYBLDRAFT_63932 [Phycomyces blakesleeanus NRRL 1555(-)]